MMTLNIEPNFLDTCLWSSWRYFIGRKTIAASMHASEIAALINNHSNDFPEDRKRWMASDIRNEINRHLSGYINVNIQGVCDHIDAFSVLGTFIEQHLKDNNLHLEDTHGHPEGTGVLDPRWYRWEIDLTDQSVVMTKSREYMDYGIRIFEETLNLTPWIKLAGFLDPTHKATICTSPSGAPEVLRDLVGFYYPSCSRYENEKFPHFYMVLTECQEYAKSPYSDIGIIPEAIRSVTRIHN